jgi:hypothetical protein
MTTPKHPMQPVVLSEDGRAYFVPNEILVWMLAHGRINFDEIAQQGFSDEDRMQLAQLLGFAVSRYTQLTYVTEAGMAEALKAFNNVTTGNASSGF